MRRSVDFWYFLIWRRATVPGLQRNFLAPGALAALALAWPDFFWVLATVVVFVRDIVFLDEKFFVIWKIFFLFEKRKTLTITIFIQSRRKDFGFKYLMIKKIILLCHALSVLRFVLGFFLLFQFYFFLFLFCFCFHKFFWVVFFCFLFFDKIFKKKKKKLCFVSFRFYNKFWCFC